MASKILNAQSNSTSSADVSEVGVAKVNHELLVEGTNELEAFGVLDHFLKRTIFEGETQKQLTAPARKALVEIFMSCVITATHHNNFIGGTPSSGKLKTVGESTSKDAANEEPKTSHTSTELLESHELEQLSVKREPSTASSKENHFKEEVSLKQQADSTCFSLTQEQVLNIFPGNNLLTFFNSVKNAKESAYEIVSRLARLPANQEGETYASEVEAFSINAFLDWVLQRGTQDVRRIWQGLLACGYNIRFER